jgi:hypothetical protein
MLHDYVRYRGSSFSVNIEANPDGYKKASIAAIDRA